MVIYPQILEGIMKKLTLLLVFIAMQLNCGSLVANASKQTKPVGDFPATLKKGICYA